MTDPISTFTNAELDRAINRAWREAARAWQEARSYDVRPRRDETGRMLDASAIEAQAYWQRLTDERLRRQEDRDAVARATVGHPEQASSLWELEQDADR